MAGNHQYANKIDLVQAPLAAGGTDVWSTKVPMAGFDGCRFIGVLGTVNSTGIVQFRIYGSTSSTANSTSTGFTLEAATANKSSTAGKSDALFDIDVSRPRSNYLSAKIDQKTASSEYGGTLAIRYKRIAESSTRGSTTLVTAAVHVVPQTTG